MAKVVSNILFPADKSPVDIGIRQYSGDNWIEFYTLCCGEGFDARSAECPCGLTAKPYATIGMRTRLPLAELAVDSGIGWTEKMLSKFFSDWTGVPLGELSIELER